MLSVGSVTRLVGMLRPEHAKSSPRESLPLRPAPRKTWQCLGRKKFFWRNSASLDAAISSLAQSRMVGFLAAGTLRVRTAASLPTECCRSTPQPIWRTGCRWGLQGFRGENTTVRLWAKKEVAVCCNESGSNAVVRRCRAFAAGVLPFECFRLPDFHAPFCDSTSLLDFAI